MAVNNALNNSSTVFTVDNLNLDGNTLSSLSGNLNLTAAASQLMQAQADGFILGRSVDGFPLEAVLENTSNTAGSDILLNVQSGGTSGGDAYVEVSISGGQAYTMGLDNSASDAFVLSRGGALGTNNVMSVNASTGAVTFTDAISSGVAGSSIGGFNISGNTSGTISINPQAAAGTFNFNLPTTAGTSGYLLTSAGGGATAMTWTDPSTLSGVLTLTGTSGGAISPTAGNITFSGGTSGITLAGSGSTLTFGGTVALANGGTNASLTASNGGIFYSTATAGAILSGTATAGKILRSGANAAPSWSTATYPATAGTSGNFLASDGTNFVSTTTLGVANGGTGVATLTGIPLGSGTSAFTAITYVAPTSWTPSLSYGGDSTGITYTTQTGTYTRIGTMVCATGLITLSNKGSGSGQAQITLPVTPSANSAGSIRILNATGLTGTVKIFVSSVANRAIPTQGGATGDTDLTDAALTNTSTMQFQVTYFA